MLHGDVTAVGAHRALLVTNQAMNSSANRGLVSFRKDYAQDGGS